MSEERVPMPPALGLVKGRVSSLPARPRRTVPDANAVEPAETSELAPESATDRVAAPMPVATESSAPAPAKPAGESRTRKSPRTKGRESTGVLKRTTLSLPQDLVDLMSERRKNTPKVSQVQFILNALAATAGRLKDLVEADNSENVGNDLFPVLSNSRASTSGGRTTIGFDTAEENLKVVDQLVTSSGAASRSQLVKVALRHVLGDN